MPTFANCIRTNMQNICNMQKYANYSNMQKYANYTNVQKYAKYARIWKICEIITCPLNANNSSLKLAIVSKVSTSQSFGIPSFLFDGTKSSC